MDYKMMSCAYCLVQVSIEMSSKVKYDKLNDSVPMLQMKFLQLKGRRLRKFH